MSARLSRMQCGGRCHRREISVLDSNRWLSGLLGGKPRNVASDDARCFGLPSKAPRVSNTQKPTDLQCFARGTGIPIAPTHASATSIPVPSMHMTRTSQFRARSTVRTVSMIRYGVRGHRQRPSPSHRVGTSQNSPKIDGWSVRLERATSVCQL